MNFGFFDFIAAILFPPRCLACGQGLYEGALCSACRRTILLSPGLRCGECNARLARGRSCHPGFPYVLGTAGSYGNEALKALIHGLKFRGVRAAAVPLAGLLTEYARELGIGLEGFAVMPIPLSRERLRVRGFNQSERIARLFAESAGLPLAPRWLTRVRHTPPQSETASLAERRENLRGCFTAPDPEAVRAQNIILLDDVCTSGATFLAAASALKAAGAGKIIALAAAQA